LDIASSTAAAWPPVARSAATACVAAAARAATARSAATACVAAAAHVDTARFAATARVDTGRSASAGCGRGCRHVGRSRKRGCSCATTLPSCRRVQSIRGPRRGCSGTSAGCGRGSSGHACCMADATLAVVASAVASAEDLEPITP
jgi:hypothetical protein